jgi:hypothetical protein
MESTKGTNAAIEIDAMRPNARIGLASYKFFKFKRELVKAVPGKQRHTYNPLALGLDR